MKGCRWQSLLGRSLLSRPCCFQSVPGFARFHVGFPKIIRSHLPSHQQTKSAQRLLPASHPFPLEVVAQTSSFVRHREAYPKSRRKDHQAHVSAAERKAVRIGAASCAVAEVAGSFSHWLQSLPLLAPIALQQALVRVILATDHSCSSAEGLGEAILVVGGEVVEE